MRNRLFYFCLCQSRLVILYKAFAVPTFKNPLKSITYRYVELLLVGIVRALLLAPTFCNPCVGNSVTWVTNLANIGLVLFKNSATDKLLPLKTSIS